MNATTSSFKITCNASTFQRRLTQAIQKAASQIDQFEEGAIVIRLVAKHPTAELWLRQPAVHGDDVNVDVDYMHSVVPGKPKTRRPGWRGNPENLEVACAGYVMGKLEGCARAVIGGYGYCSDDLPAKLVVDGRNNSRGAMCFDIMPFDRQTGELISDDPWLRVYVGVSGATGAEDKWCAYHAWNALVECTGAFRPEHIRRPENYDPHIAAFKGEIKFKPGYGPTTGIRNFHPTGSGFDHVDSIC